MRSPFILLAVITIALCLSGCKNTGTKPDSEVNTFTLEDFNIVDLKELSEEISSDPDLIGIVKELRVINDSILAISQVMSETNVKLYNLNSGKQQVAIRRGNGPLELADASSLSVDADGNLLIAGSFDHKVISARWNPAGNNAVAELTFTPAENYMKTVVGSGDRLVALTPPNYQKRLIVIDRTNGIVDSTGTFPVAALPDSNAPSNYMFQADIAYSPKAGKVVIVNKSWNEIGICELGGDDSEIKLSGPVFPNLSVVDYGGNAGHQFGIKPLWFMFSGASASKECFYVGYIGAEVKSKEDFDRQTGSILEFGWNGKPLRRFVLPAEAVAFDIDFANNILYTVENRPDPTLVKYTL